MAKKRVGIALGGGSALGFAHLGVLQVFEREQIPVDMIAGCSMGALLGGIYASGCNLEKLIDFARVFNDRKYIDFNVPFTSDGYLQGDKVEELVRTMTEGIAFEQAKIPFSCLATHLESATAVYFDSGPMYKAIRASISIPGIFQPETIDGMTLVDGGIMDRSAITALEKMNPDVMIAVNVSTCVPPFPTPKTAREVLSVSYTILSWHAVEPRYADAAVVITPDLAGFSGNSYDDKQIAEIIQEGARAAEAMLDDIRLAIS